MAKETLQISRIYKDLDLNFTKNPVTGDVGKKTDVNAVKQALSILINTNFYERPFDPGKAANLRGYLFEQMSKTIAALMVENIKNIVSSYEPRAKIESVIVTPNFDKNEYSIALRYYVVGVSRPQILTTTLKRLR